MHKNTPLQVALPVTPFLDMSFQLLAFFVLTVRFMPAEGQLALARSPGNGGATIGDPNDSGQVRDAYVVRVKASATGDIAEMSLVGPAQSMGELRTTDDLFRQLKAIPNPAGKAAKVSMTIESARELRYARLVEILDLCKRAGFDAVSLAPMRP